MATSTNDNSRTGASEALRDEAYRIAGKPDPVEFEDEVVAVVESRDGSILDVIRKIRE